MDTWNTDEVCAWLATIEGIEQRGIDLFKSKKIRGTALQNMTEEKMTRHFSQLEIGDIWEILDKKNKFQPQPLAAVQGSSTHSQDHCSTAITKQSTKHPVQCTSGRTSQEHHFSLDIFERQKSVDEGPETLNQPTRSPPAYPSANGIALHVSTDSLKEQPDSKDTPLKQPQTDPQETLLKQPYEKDLHNTPLKEPVKDNLQESLFKQTLDLENTPNTEKDSHELQGTCTELNVCQIDNHNLNNEPNEGNSRTPPDSPEIKSAAGLEYKEVEVTQCREFGTERDEEMTYKQGSMISCREGIQYAMVHKFADPGRIKGNKERVSFVRETVSFLCACLNEGYKGTVHFGIVSEGEEQNESEKSGMIKGVQFSHSCLNEFESEFRRSLCKCFAPDQIDIVNQCIGKLQCIPVDPAVTNIAVGHLFIIEVDIAPTASASEEAFFIKLPSYEIEKKKVCYASGGALFRICTRGRVQECDGEDLTTYMRRKEEIAQAHKKKEERERITKALHVKLEQGLHQKLRDLLCKGDDDLPVDTYPILVLNKPSDTMSANEMKQSLSFLSSIPLKATFDFDDNASVSEYMEAIERKQLKIISTADDFMKTSRVNQLNPDRLKNLQDDMKHSAIQSWIYVNGLRGKKKSPLEWNRENKEGFKEAVRFFHQEIPKGRALIVFLLLSEDQDVMIEAAEELITSFRDQWMCICESKTIAEKWSTELIRRNYIDENTWKENSIVGMPLPKICECIKLLQGPMKTSTETTVITKSGDGISLTEEFADLEVLSADQCDSFNLTPPATFGNQHEEEFYKGGQVNWWNFWHEHVLHRTKLDDLQKLIDKAMSGGINEEDQHIAKVVTLYHQAGAGGTTLAMHALWNNRKAYRCAVVNIISDIGDTAEQILKLHWYGETDQPKPVLILLDNLEEEKSKFLLRELEERAKHKSRMELLNPYVLCVVINCVRRNKLPQENKNKRILLKHELDKREIAWFQKKYKEMEKKNRKALVGDPELLISFNIMKENFSEAFMRKMVSRLLYDIRDEKERKLLKYVSLLNAYDIQNQAIPRVAFDRMMTTVWQSGPRHGNRAHQDRWESKLTSSTKILLNVTPHISFGFIKAIRIASPLLAKHILAALQQSKQGNQTLSDMAIEMFHTDDLFSDSSTSVRDSLVDIVKDVLKSRTKNEFGVPDSKFAPIIEDIIRSETVDKAVEVMEAGFQLINDPFIGQQVARLYYIHASNWAKAKDFAKTAIDMKPDNSFLWDTYGRIYLSELIEHWKSIEASTNISLQPIDCLPILECAFAGMTNFQRVQELSQREKHFIDNEFGYFGAVEVIVSLLDCLSYVSVFYNNSEHLKRFLVEPDFEVPEMKALDQENPEICFTLKRLGEIANHAMKKMEDEYIQLREDNLLDGTQKHMMGPGVAQLRTLGNRLNKYFGEEQDVAPRELSEEEQCRYRRRRVIQLGASSMMRIFDIKQQERGKEQLERIRDIIKLNIGTRYENADDLQTLMCANLALIQILPLELVPENMFKDMTNMSQRLYEKRGTREFSFTHLEPYLFYVIFNWPQTEKEKISGETAVPRTKPVTHRMLIDALKKWKEAYFEKYPKQKDEGNPYQKKDTTTFFFANGKGMKSIISNVLLNKLVKRMEVKMAFWAQPNIKQKLKRFDGILCSDGDEVDLTIVYPGGNKDKLNLKTSFPIKDRKLLDKRVDFVIGFTWKGPKAFDVQLKTPYDSAEGELLTTEAASQELPVQPAILKQDARPGSGTERKLTKIERELQEIAVLKAKKDKGAALSPVEVCHAFRSPPFILNKQQ